MFTTDLHSTLLARRFIKVNEGVPGSVTNPLLIPVHGQVHDTI